MRPEPYRLRRRDRPAPRRVLDAARPPRPRVDRPLVTGDAVAAGAPIARLGAEDVNGGWPPHLHLQLFTALPGRATDLPGVAYPDEADIWKSVSPDPNLLLGRPDGDRARTPRADLRERRRTVMSRALSLAYREPLEIVGGEGAHLIDAAGIRWLDLVNNVAHVGHCHPRVVAAGQRQMAVLNTNTRYLHPAVVEYARRLAATFPDPLTCASSSTPAGGQRPRAAGGEGAHRPRGRARARPRLPRQPRLADRHQPVQVQTGWAGAGGTSGTRSPGPATRIGARPGGAGSGGVLRRAAAGLRRPGRVPAGLPGGGVRRTCGRPAGCAWSTRYRPASGGSATHSGASS